MSDVALPRAVLLDTCAVIWLAKAIRWQGRRRLQLSRPAAREACSFHQFPLGKLAY